MPLKPFVKTVKPLLHHLPMRGLDIGFIHVLLVYCKFEEEPDWFNSNKCFVLFCIKKTPGPIQIF